MKPRWIGLPTYDGQVEAMLRNWQEEVDWKSAVRLDYIDEKGQRWHLRDTPDPRLVKK